MRYIKLSTEICKWEWFTDGNMLKLWIYLLTNAQQFKDTNYRGIKIKKGQVIVGRQALSKQLNMSEQQIRTCINRLKSTNEITTKTTNKFTLITIVNYDKFQTNLTDINQENNQVVNQQITNKQPTNNQQITTSKRERGKERNKEYIYKGSEKLVSAFEDFEQMRKQIKKPLTDRARQLIINRLNNYTTNEEEQIAILNQSIVNCWQNIYPIKPNHTLSANTNTQADTLPTYDTSINKSLSNEEENELLKIMGRMQ